MAFEAVDGQVTVVASPLRHQTLTISHPRVRSLCRSARLHEGPSLNSCPDHLGAAERDDDVAPQHVCVFKNALDAFMR